ncbi:MAG: putative DNA-binding domain-containing protein [Fibrobacteria bacterium]
MADPRKKTPDLAGLQTWFGQAISRPLPEEYPGNPLALSAPELEPDADARLRTKGGLTGFGRLGIYNQQYWFRLISVMQSDYTCAIHLMGLRDFNDWAVRYLTAHPPSSPFLAELDAGFPAFLEAGYQGPERQAVLQAVAYERALSKAFDAAEGESLAAAGFTETARLMAARLRLAPHVTALHVDWDFAEYRVRCLADESLEAEIAPVRGSADLVIFRDADLDVMKEPVSAAALAVLREFREPAALLDAFGNLEGRLTAAEQAELETGISAWFKDWVARGWLCHAES